MRSVLLSLAGLRLPAGSWATATLAAIQRVTGLAPWASFFETTSFSSSRVGAAMERKPWRNSTMVAPLVLQPERNVGRVPGVVGDLLDVEQRGIGANPLLDGTIGARR